MSRDWTSIIGIIIAIVSAVFTAIGAYYTREQFRIMRGQHTKNSKGPVAGRAKAREILGVITTVVGASILVLTIIIIGSPPNEQGAVKPPQPTPYKPPPNSAIEVRNRPFPPLRDLELAGTWACVQQDGSTVTINFDKDGRYEELVYGQPGRIKGEYDYQRGPSTVMLKSDNPFKIESGKITWNGQQQFDYEVWGDYRTPIKAHYKCTRNA